ncbi:E3 SUMO-protein ligase PIAS2-like isoform X4 [Halichondria panicea]|uniref:E3 SUMO-protein ligase PIAS2-like isoform X4 n=1 Tax=Halichondria panicea TaxID=6063 RepID=UPI00312B8191
MASSERYHSSHSRGSSSEDQRAECQGMLSEFRVNELKELLRKTSQSQRGRKAELFQRANELLRHGSPKIQLYIRDIYQTVRPYRSPKRGSPAKAQACLRLAQQLAHQQSRQGYVVHPDVKFKPHPFFRLKETIIRPTALVSTAHSPSGGCTMRVQFFLSPVQVQEIYTSKNSQGDYSNQVIVRFARQETSCEQEDFYPKQCYIKVNDNYVEIPGYAPQYSHRPDYKRMGKPVDITNFIKTSASHTNDVVLYWHQDIMYPQGFCVTIEHVKSLSSSDLLTGLKSKGLRSPDISRALVKEKLTTDADSEISATSLRISLICPLGKIRMTNPSRAMGCSHLQCFDASIYLQMNERKAQWICPVCDKTAPFKDLFVDGLFKEICERSTSDIIEFSSDGTWKSFSNKITAHNILTPDMKHNNGTITVKSTPEKRAGQTCNNPIIIDLTLSDSEDEEPITQLSRKSSTSSETGSSTSACSSNLSGTLDERDSTRHPTSAQSSHWMITSSRY